MEELRSTEILDREIQDDARRKAEKILKASEAECRQILDDVNARLARVKAEKEAEFARLLAAYRRDAESVIPLEKQRRLVTFMDSSVQEALDAWFRGIGAAKRLSLYERRLERYKPILSGATLAVRFFGYSEREIRDMAVKAFGKDSVASVTALDAKSAQAVGCSDGLYIETTDQAIRCRASLEEIRDELLQGLRQELAETLLGGRLPE